MDDYLPLVCNRCAAVLTPGEGNFYVVRIEAAADPTPPTVDAEKLAGDFRSEMRHLIQQMNDQSEQELMDQVYRRLMFYLCADCYASWIENPTG
jgi:hypothetical protein